MEITNDTRELVRNTILQGVQEGQGADKIARDLVGRLNRATGKREGGLLGLTSLQAGYVGKARQQLLSGDPEQLREYLKRGRRDARFDRMVLKAIRDGKPLKQADVDKVTGRYADRLLQLRGDTIARNEVLAALHAGQAEGMQQLIDSGKVRADQITKTWGATGDGRTRDSHMAMDKQSVAWGQPFVTPLGYKMQHPQDTSLGAPPSETIQCRCFMQVKVNYLA